MFRNLDPEKSKKLDESLASKIKVKKFVTRQEADAIKKALGAPEKLEKRAEEKDETSKILKRLDRFNGLSK